MADQACQIPPVLTLHDHKERAPGYAQVLFSLAETLREHADNAEGLARRFHTDPERLTDEDIRAMQDLASDLIPRLSRR